MKKVFGIISSVYLILFNISLYADWKDTAKNWNKYDADKILQEKYQQYDITNLTLPDKVTDTQGKINGVLDKASSFGLDKYLGGAIGDAKSMVNMVDNELYQNLIMSTGLQLLGGADSALLGVCYEKTIDWSMPEIKMPDIKIDPCIKFNAGFDGVDMCGALPEIPGYIKKSRKLLEIEQRNVKLFCNGWDDMVQIEKVPIEKKLLQNDISKSVVNSKKISENTNVIDKIKRTKVDDVGDMSDFKYKKKIKDKNGNLIKDEFGQAKTVIVQPFKGVEDQDTEEKRNAHKFVKKILEKEAAENKDIDTIEQSKKLTLAHLDKANIAFKNEHEYELARNEAIDALNFIEKDVYDTHDEILLFRTKVMEYEENEKDVLKKAGQIKAEKESLMIQYKKRIDKWRQIKESYYFDFEKKGIHAPTAYYIDSVTKNLEDGEKHIKRASLIYQVDKEMNIDAQHISKLRVKADMLIREFERKLDIEIISNRKFDLEKAMLSVEN